MTAFSERVDVVARRAGAAVLDVYARQTVGAFAKTDGSPVTAADAASHDILTAGLRDLASGVAIVSEEDGSPPGPVPEPAAAPRRYWLLDPLDGTREFLAGNGEFCVCVALIEDGRPVYGLIHVPVAGESYYASESSGGAFVTRGDGARRLAPRAGVEMGAAGLRVGVSRSHRGGSTEAFVRRLPGARSVPMGSALKFCAIAAGTLDLYVRHGPTMHWDTAAGQCLLEAVGLGVYDLATGRPLRYDGDARRNPAFLAGPRPS